MTLVTFVWNLVSWNSYGDCCACHLDMWLCLFSFECQSLEEQAKSQPITKGMYIRGVLGVGGAVKENGAGDRTTWD